MSLHAQGKDLATALGLDGKPHSLPGEQDPQFHCSQSPAKALAPDTLPSPPLRGCVGRGGRGTLLPQERGALGRGVFGFIHFLVHT